MELTLEQLTKAFIEFTLMVKQGFDICMGGLAQLSTDIEKILLSQDAIIDMIENLEHLLNIVAIHGIFNTVLISCIIVYLMFSHKKGRS
jgi:hypothetical protein